MASCGDRPVRYPKETVQELGFKNRLHPLPQRLLDHTVTHRGYPELSDAAIGRVDLDPLDGMRPRGPVSKLAMPQVQVIPLAPRKLLSGDRINTGTAVVLLHALPGMLQILATAYLVDQRMDVLLT
jgi:hypothetical protein